MPTIADQPDIPRFPIRAASARTGVPSVTLRAWERRHHVIIPRRTASNYRLYSERDVAILRWVKDRVDSGTALREAAAEVGAMRRSGRWPTVPDPMPIATDDNATPASASANASAAADALSRRLYAALIARNETRAAEVLRTAHSRMDVESICLRIIQPCLVAIGEAWHRGDVRIATEHFASQLLRGHVMALYQSLPVRGRAPRVVVGCAPRERHDIGALMLALVLRRAGYRVEFLGADVHLADLVEYARSSRPDLVCLSANAEETALALQLLKGQLDALMPAPPFGYGGAAFHRDPALRARVPGHYLGGDPVAAVARVRELLPIGAV